MKKAILFLVLILAASLIFWKLFKSKDGENKTSDTKEVAIAVKQHSENFNKSISRIVDKYMNIKDAFVNADTAAIKLSGAEFILLLDAIDTAELKKDTSLIEATIISVINDLKSNAISMLSQHDITEMRKDFSSLTDMMFPAFFTAIKYEGPTLYIQNCPMAFNDEIPANWISTTEEVINPYLGKNHPKYKAGMLHCGEIVDSVKSK
jgi:hypothetical protein